MFTVSVYNRLTVVVVPLQTPEANEIGVSGAVSIVRRSGQGQNAHAGAAAPPGRTRRSSRAARSRRHLDNRRHLGKRRGGQGSGGRAR